MSRWTHFRDRVNKAVGAAVTHPATVLKSASRPRELFKKDSTGVTGLDRIAVPFSYDKTALGIHKIVGIAIGGYYAAGAVGVGGASGAGTGAVEVGVAGTDVGVAAGSAGGTGLVGGSAAAGGTAAAGSGIFSGSNISTLALALSALRKGNVAGAVDAVTGTDWGTQAASFFGGGGGGGGGARMGPNDGPQEPGSGGISPIFLAIGGVLLIVGLFFLFRKVFHHGT